MNDASDQGLHGYALMKTMHKKFGIRPSASSLYPGLQVLEKQGLVVSSWELGPGRAHKQYRITRRGQVLLREYSIELKTVIFPLVAYSS
jgi:DNA-binding PadR family transcriptional regulator